MTKMFILNRLFIFLCCILISLTIEAKEWIYVTSDGDTLYDISKKYLHHAGYWKKVQKLNHIRHPSELKGDMQLRIPLEWIKISTIAAKVVSIQGSVTLLWAKNSGNKPISVGTPIRLGDTIYTEANSNVVVEFANKNRIIIRENSHVTFDYLSAYAGSGMVDSRVRLINGRLDSKIRPTKGSGSRFEIHTPSAITAVRGTEYRLNSKQENMTSILEVTKGKVAISAQKKVHIIPQGYGSVVEKDKAPTAAKKLLSAPIISPLPDRIRELNYFVSWEKIDQALQYRVEIAKLNDFSSAFPCWTQSRN